ncbi:MAG: hypothetical protein U9R58_13660 [Chloroflexota bacterium]|nr:hypothetical protein [Chloroflexota bacterium]
MTDHNLQLEGGSKIGIIGGGLAGSFCAFFILATALRFGMDLQVDIYEPLN